MLHLCARLTLALLAGLPVALAAAPAQAADVVVTIKPLHALVARVMAGAGEPHLLVQGTMSAHTYALKPSDMRRLSAADVFFRMSDVMEPFTARVVKALPARVQVVTLEDSPAMHLLERRTSATFADDPHAHDRDQGTDHGHDRNPGHAHGPGSGSIDGHAWLDPVNAKAMADRIAEVLGAKDPARAAAYRANADRLRADLDALDAELRHELAGVAGKPFVVFHDALQYFEQRYGLKAVGAIAISPEVPPGAGRLSRLRRQLAEQGVGCVLAEPQLDTRLVSTLVEDTRARIGSIDPEGSRIAPGPEHYPTLLRTLARDIKACLTPP